MAERLDLSLNAWAVLAVLVDDGPNHGFALSKQLAKGTEIGRVWSVSRPLVYRALDQLTERGLIRPGAEQPGNAGPNRHEYRATPKGRAASQRWRATPVTHLREVRPDLVLKLVVTVRAGQDVGRLLVAQHEEFAPLLAQLASECADATGPARVVAVWRRELGQAVERTLAELSEGP